MKNSIAFIIIIIWFIITTISCIWNFKVVNKNTSLIVKKQAQSFFQEIQTSRAWNAGHGGVYVPITEKTKPNQYLKTANREIYIDSLGIALTKVNPAFMTRQIAEIAEKNNSIKFHITSLKPIRPQNKADSWETIQLNKFETGATEFIEYIENDSAYRYMAALPVKSVCMKCHEEQGYKVGDIRGGISITIKGVKYKELVFRQKVSILIFHSIIFMIGIVSILLFQRYSKTQFKKLHFEKIVIRQRNIELKKNERKLQEINNIKDKFFSIIAHDLRSPLGAMVGFSSMLLNNFDEYDKESQKEYVGIIHDGIQNTFELLENLLLWSRSQRGTIDYNPEKINLFLISNDTINILKQLAITKMITITNKIPKNIFVTADINMLQTILRNLITNAIKFTPKKGKIKIYSQMVSDKKNHFYTETTVKDTGIGIAKDKQNKLFSIADDSSAKGTEGESGTGLGLILCKEFVEKHGGKIWVESEFGKGSEFVFTIPVRV